MSWSVLKFGRHAGKTLPQILFSDPDWFFWAIEQNLFKEPLRNEAMEINAKARNIRIPNSGKENLVVEYFVHPPTGKFSHMEIVPASHPKHEGASPSFRRPVIDLSVPRKIAPYDKLGGKNLISEVKYVIFGSKFARMSQERCDVFFDDPSKFVL